MPSSNRRGLIAMLIAVAALSLMDAGLKILSPHYPALQITSIRGFSALPLTLVWVYLRGGFGQLVNVRAKLHLLRAVLGVTMLSLFAYALRHLSLADAYTIFFVSPVFIAVLAATILHERVDARRWIAIGAGFAGVVLVLRPSGAGVLSAPGLAVLGTAALYAGSAITVRILGRTDSTQSMVFWLMTMMGVVAGALALPQWKPIDPSHWLVIGGIALTGSLGQWAITEAFKHGEPSFVAPFEYTALAWGVGLDWFVWKTFPAPITFVGAAVIIASGVYLVRRERVHLEAEHP
ncbi:MAG TPA: DMT family transporter [Gemmatimonadaceae bacterium]|nr:DMT family transporter [Gemmatimonadaceae bacterium]